jgi:hypothetical protein
MSRSQDDLFAVIRQVAAAAATMLHSQKKKSAPFPPDPPNPRFFSSSWSALPKRQKESRIWRISLINAEKPETLFCFF